MSQHETLRELRCNIAAAMARLGDDWRNDRDGNTMNGSLELSYHQRRQIHAAAKTLLPSQRSDFVHGVKRRLGHNRYNEAAERVIATRVAFNCPRSCVNQTLEQTNGKNIPNT